MPFFPAARASLDVGPADVGRRLTIRYRSGEGLSRAESELVGVLFRWSGGLSDGILRLRKRDGLEVGVRADDLISARVVPPEQSAYALQRLCQQGWPPLESADLGSWVMRASKGATGRANSVRVAGRPSDGVRAALQSIREWYDERELPPRVQITVPSGIEDRLEDAEWSGRRTSRVMVVPVSKLLNATSDSHQRSDLDISIKQDPDLDFMRLAPGWSPETAAEFDHAYGAIRPAAFVYCRNTEGTLMGIGHAVLQDSWCGATTLQTLPQLRRNGIASAVIAQMAQWAHEQGASHWYLQLFEDNAAALGFFESLGFVTHHQYEYRWPSDLAPERLWPELSRGAQGA